MATMKVYVPLFMAFFSGFMQLSMAQDNLTAAARVIDAKAIDQADRVLTHVRGTVCHVDL
ncbi:hypothetical protein EJB05_54062, partial [Eragrostis curvula]